MIYILLLTYMKKELVGVVEQYLSPEFCQTRNQFKIECSGNVGGANQGHKK